MAFFRKFWSKGRARSRPLLKICGVNDPAFAAAAEKAGADFLGFIFVPSSPRAVTAVRVREIRDGLAGSARLVGVFTDAPVYSIAATAISLSLDVVQLHSPRSAGDVLLLQHFGFEVWRLDDGTETPADAILLDGRAGEQTGGTGRLADWDRAAALSAAGRRVVLAGGLSADNLAAAHSSTHAAVYDVNSALEVSPGVKSSDLLPPLFRVWNKIKQK